jgi:hypothetical protein
MKTKDTRIGKGAPDLPGGAMNSEHESDAARIPSPASNRTAKDGSGPTGPDAGRRPHDLAATSKTDLEKEMEAREGRQPHRTPEEMSLHEELDMTRKGEKQ